MSAAPQPKNDRFSWDDYRRMGDDERVEIVHGALFAMSPAPRWRHQHIVTELGRQLGNFLQGKRCVAAVAPVDVKLSDEDIVQPDVVVVCDRNQIKDTHVEGAPSLVVEVLSPDSHFHDRVRKLRLYADSGVTEFWIVTPYPHMIEIFHRAHETLQFHSGFDRDGEFRSPLFPDLRLDLKSVFNFPLEPGEEVRMIMREDRPRPMPATH